MIIGVKVIYSFPITYPSSDVDIARRIDGWYQIKIRFSWGSCKDIQIYPRGWFL